MDEYMNRKVGKLFDIISKIYRKQKVNKKKKERKKQIYRKWRNRQRGLESRCKIVH